MEQDNFRSAKTYKDQEHAWWDDKAESYDNWLKPLMEQRVLLCWKALMPVMA